MNPQPNGQTIARQRIETEARDRTGFLDLSQLGLTEFPVAVLALGHLRRLHLGPALVQTEGYWERDWSADGPTNRFSELGRLAGLRNLTALSIGGLQCNDLAFVNGLAGLLWLDCSSTQVSELGPLAGLPALQTLDCTNTQVSELGPLAGLPALQTLYCSDTQVSELGPLAGLPALQTLDCTNTQVSELGPLAGLPALQTLDCTNTQVSELGPLAGLPALQTLYCSDTQVSELGPLAGLPALQTLYCSSTQVSELGPLAALPALQTLYCTNTQVSELGPLAGLPALQTLNCTNTQVSELGPLAALPALQTLYCTNTQVSELGPLAGLPALQTLNCTNTQVSELGPLAALPALQTLDCSFTQVSELGPLAGLPALQTLDCSFTQVSELGPLAGLPALQTLNCTNTQVSELGPLAGLPALQTLYCTNTQVSELGPLAALPALQTLYCSDTQVSELGPLAGLPALQTLNCTNTQVSELGPLAALPALQTLDCTNTQVSELGPLAALPALQTLNCTNTQVSELGPLAGLPALQTLDCSFTQVSELGPLAALPALQTLNCTNTQVSELGPLAGLPALQTLNCTNTQVSELGPLAGLPALQTLDCTNTQVSELGPLAGLPALQTLYCSDTQVSELGPLAGLPALQELDCSHCLLGDVPDPVWHLPTLTKIVLYQSSVSGILAEVLSQGYDENCLDAVRAHLRDKQAGVEALTDVKLLVLGNGRSGKTQLARFLCGDPFQPEWDSTHGIRVVNTRLPATQSQPAPTLHIWDFGGQDIYHGTHALFIRTRAVFALIWASDTEPPPLTYDHQGLTFRNHPLQYWATYVGHLNADQGPVMVVQTKCDTDAEEAMVFPLPPEARTLLGPVREVRFSALSRHRGHEELLATLRGAITRLWEHQGIAEIGKGRLKLQRKIEALRQPDGSLPDQWKRMDKPTFRAWCEQAGDISSPDEMLRYLHNAGIVIYQKGLFDDQIVLDHAWALNAIYAVFDRTKSYRRLLQDQGRFDRPRLQELVWPDFTPDEQRLFLTMMRSSGICFIYRSSPSRREDDDTIYIAPDLLPERATVQTQIEARWGVDPPQASVTFDYPMLHPGLMRALIARIGDRAGIDAIYWRGGVTVYETDLRSHALIEHAIPGGACAGTVMLQTKGGQARELLDRLADWIKEENDRLGLRATISDASPQRQTAPAKRSRRTRHNPKAPAGADRQQEHSSVVKFGPVPPSRPECSVSYAWNDATPRGPDRESVVDQLEAGAKQHGLHLLRDKTDMQLGDRISEFMRQLVTSERVFVILSDKYLHSIYCMSELHEIWRRCVDDKTFIDRVRVLTLPDANIADIFKQLEIVKWWQERQRKIKEAATEVDWRLSGPHFDEYRQTGKIADDASAILALVQDTLRPKRAEDLLRIAFEGLPRH